MMRELTLKALEQARKDRAELCNTYFNLAVAAREKDEERADRLLRAACDQAIIVEGLDRNIKLLKEES